MTNLLQQLQKKTEIKDVDEDIEISITINKTQVEDKISIYNLNSLHNYLYSLNLQGILYVLNQKFNIDKPLLLESQTEIINIKTKSIWISNEFNDYTLDNIKSLRLKRISAAKSVCHFNLLSLYSFIPEDFFIEESSNDDFKQLLNKIALAYSIAFLFDITSINNSTIEFKLNGYKSIKSEIEFNDLNPENTGEYFTIYDWCYNQGNINDKIGLSRNIISLHFIQIGKLDLKGNAFQSIQSSYKVYEKQNIKQYIEIRNKISDQLLNFHDRANKVIESFASGFQKSALALISFYISAFAIKFLGKNDLKGVFTLDATLLTIAFIFCSFIYFFISVWEVKQQRKRFENSYLNLKARNSDLLDPEDIKRILNNDKEFTDDLKFIDSKRKYYSLLWISFLLIILSTTIILYLANNISQLSNTTFIKILFTKNCNY